jgi:hypothetical protein
MENKVKHEFNSSITGKLQYMEDGSLFVKNVATEKTFSEEEMKEIAFAYKGSNRIHKPFALLFWTDCRNGKLKEWEQ